MIYPNRLNYRQIEERPKAFWGALIGAAASLVGGLISSSSQSRAQKRAMEEQQRLAQQQLEVSNQNNLAATLNNYAAAQDSYDTNDYNLKYRNGGTRRLGSNRIVITDGGNARKIGNNTYLLRGGSHEDINETGQTGIGINVGGNEIEAEGGEVAQKKNGALRIFSAQPMLGGISPAQAVMSGANKDKVFNAQQRFKSRHHLSDGGGKAKHGTEVPYKRIHINEDGTFTDTLTGKNYNTSATNGEDVVIIGKANHWKEAGKKNTSSYFDPMGAVNFITAAGAPILNANPSNIVGSIRNSKNASDFLKHYMMQDTGGFVNTKWAKEHPYLSLGINTIGDIGLGYGLGKTGVGLYRLRPSNLRKHIFENISPIGYDKAIPRIKAAFKSALSGAEADIDNPSWFNDKSTQDLNTYNVGITKSMFGPHALEARFDAWRKYLGLPQKFNTWTESPIVKDAYTDTKGISNLKVLPKEQSVDFINSAGGNVANNIEEFTTRGYNGQKYGISHIRDTWDLQPWSRLRGNIIEDKVIRPLYNTTIGKANRKLSSGLHKFINKYGYDNEAIQKYLNENGEEALDNLSDVIEYFADTKSIKGKLAHKLSGLDDVLNDKAYYTMNKDSKLSKLTNKLSNKIKNFEASSLLPGAKPFKIAYDIPWTNEVFPNNEMVKGFNMTNNLPTEAYRYKLKNPLLDYTYRLGGRCKLRNGGLTSKDRGSSKHPYPSVASKDFAGGNRSYPIPTKADAIDALRLASLHGRSDVRSKVYSKYPELRKKARGGTKVDPYYDWARNTSSNLGISFIDPTYDYRTYYNSISPYERNLIRFAPQGTHFTDIGKTPKHPTFSNESIYSNKKHPGGTWNGNVFVPNIWQFGNNGNKARNKYMNNSGEGYFNGRVNVFPKYRKKADFGTNISLDSSYGNKDFLHRITQGHPTARKIVNEIFGDEADRRRVIQDLNMLGLTSDNASGIAGVIPMFRQPIINAARQVQFIQDANKVRQAANANKVRQAANYAQQQIDYVKELSDRMSATMRNVGEQLGIRVNPNPNNSVRRLYSSNFKPTKTNNRITAPRETPMNTSNSSMETPINSTTTSATNTPTYSGKTTKFNTKYRSYRNAGFSPRTSKNLVKANKLGLYSTIGGFGTIGAGTLIGANINKTDKSNKTQLDAKGQPISSYVARPQEPVKPQVKKSVPARKDTIATKPATRQVPASVARKDTTRTDTTRTDTTKQVNKVVKRQVRTTPQYTGNTTRGNYQLHDGETKVINGIKYTRRGNTIINHKTNVGYVYDKNGNYTGQADYSKVGKNFNDAFDAARAAGRSQFIYRAGKYNNYSTSKETDAKKEALNRKVGLRRIAKKCGGIATPRRRYADGGITNLTGTTVYGRNRFNTSAWDNYMRNKALGFMNNMSIPNTPYQQSSYTPQVQSYLNLMSTPFNGRQSSFKPSTQDYIGLGIDTLAALGSGLFTRSAYNKLNFDYNLPSYVDETPVAFDTTYHNEAQRANVERNRINGRNLIQGNTASAQTALSRMQEGDTNAMMELNKLADEKANKEVELRNQNAANEQQVRARNAAARNQYYQNVAQIQNAALEAKNNAALAKAQSIGADLSGLAQAWSNFATSVENRYDSRQNQIAMVASANNPAVTQTALRMGYDFSPETLAGLYNTTNDENMKRLILSKMSTRDRIRYGIK